MLTWELELLFLGGKGLLELLVVSVTVDNLVFCLSFLYCCEAVLRARRAAWLTVVLINIGAVNFFCPDPNSASAVCRLSCSHRWSPLSCTSSRG